MPNPEYREARNEIVPGSGGLRLTSRSRRPLTKGPGGGFVFGLNEQEVPLAGRRIPIQLFVPPGLFSARSYATRRL